MSNIQNGNWVVSTNPLHADNGGGEILRDGYHFLDLLAWRWSCGREQRRASRGRRPASGEVVSKAGQK